MADKIGHGMEEKCYGHADVVMKLMVRVYNQGYAAGHNETIDGCYVHIDQYDKSTYHEEYVHEFIVDVLSNLLEGLNES